MDNAFATVADLEARWRPLTDTERARAETLLVDAASLIRDTCPATWQAAGEATLRRVSCAVVKRAMVAPAGDMDLIGVASQQATVGPFSQQITFRDPGGDLYLTAAEKRSLGKGRPAAFEDNVLARLTGG
ncbi:MAG: hypothetical protein E7Z96_02650 [Actinomycetaceae bacterium]|nr:hypothetical protein [Actinomycetaceae bacterium]